jgi:alpha-tubulin suppressor-like RCC1 family protein
MAFDHTCVALFDGRAKCWGGNTHRELGTTSSKPTVGVDVGDMGAGLRPMCLPPGDRAVQFAIGWTTICVLLGSGGVVCFGQDAGTCERPVRLPLESHRAVSIAGGSSHWCVLLDDGAIECWGTNQAGQLGLGDLRRRSIDDMAGEQTRVDLGAGRRARAVSAGSEFTCALLDQGGVKCWGWYNLIGLGSRKSRGGAPGEMGDALPEVNLGTGRTATAISSGPDHTCATLDSGDLKCWGLGGLGFPRNQYVGDDPGEMGDALPAVQLGTGHRAVTVSAGLGATCAILEDGGLKCWGGNPYGGLGLGDNRPRGDERPDMGDALPEVSLGQGRTARLVSVGSLNTCAVLDDDEVKCWGAETAGALGIEVHWNIPHHPPGATPDTVPAKLPAVDIGP